MLRWEVAESAVRIRFRRPRAYASGYRQCRQTRTTNLGTFVAASRRKIPTTPRDVTSAAHQDAMRGVRPESGYLQETVSTRDISLVPDAVL